MTQYGWNEIEKIKEAFLKEVTAVQSLDKLKFLRDQYLSRKNGKVSALLKSLKDIPTSERPEAGKQINLLKVLVESELKNLESGFSVTQSRKIDYSLPHSHFPRGHIHLISHIQQEIEDIFISMGYHIADGPEVETEYYNFSALNFLEDHPARDEQDTFFIKGAGDLILRTHTSPVQARYMEKHKPPVKIIAPGTVFRKDEPDATHSPVFHQVEGLLVDRGINFSHLKGTLELFVKSFYGPDIKLRFRPSYFPFTEPSAEIDISCFSCAGKKATCRICKGSGWLEILGSGMVHPQVLRNCNIDPDQFSGFAFGMGIERIAMLKYGVNDIRMLYENDLRFSRQFG